MVHEAKLVCVSAMEGHNVVEESTSECESQKGTIVPIGFNKVVVSHSSDEGDRLFLGHLFGMKINYGEWSAGVTFMLGWLDFGFWMRIWYDEVLFIS
ncbi:hypothetical protein V6N13_053708 [Hibiscus sabdariffa]|uniref:Uncharacterized protein n=1 Tax=Hibiscus sabdariffa TaxID=183260 RepID=A0ABR2T7E8_9ROSI